MKQKNTPDKNQISSIEQINAQYGKLPPQAIDAEEAVLGAVMLERDAIYKVNSMLTPEMFYKEEHRLIFEAVDQLATARKAIDLLTITQHLRDKELVDQVGGPGYITELTRRVASAAHIEQHARIINDKFVAREIIRRCSEITANAYADDFDELEMCYAMHTQAIDDMMAGSNGMKHIKQVLIQTSENLVSRQLASKNGETPGINCGLADLNNWIAGWQPGELIVVAARPGMGKTAVALNVFAKSAANQFKNVNFFTLEMEDNKLAERLIMSYGGIVRENMKSGRFTDGDWTAINSAMSNLRKLPFYIDDTAGVNVRYLETVIRNKTRRGECDLVIIDYLQLVEATAGYNKNREREVAEISRSLKKIAKSCKIPIILLAQLNRGLENRDDKKPRLADLRESGSIEQDADIVIFPWRPCVYDENAEVNGQSLKGIMFFEIAKNREGNTGTLWAGHSTDLTQFYDSNYRHHEVF